MALMFQEREAETCKLQSALADAHEGRGRVVFVSGEAGIGKTTFVDHFVSRHVGTGKAFTGHCDPLFTPSLLGPFHDIAHAVKGELLQTVQGANSREFIFSGFLEFLLSHSDATVVVFEDIHWADDATLDLIKYVARRLEKSHILLIVTMRNDALNLHSSLRMFLGAMSGIRTILRIEMPALSVGAVKTLVGSHKLDADELHKKTSGNPFYITEVLASPGSKLPLTIRDAVLARISPLSLQGREILELAAAIGSRIDQRLLAEVAGAESSSLGECIDTGILQVIAEEMVFRHELARDVVLESIEPLRRRMFGRRILSAMLNLPGLSPSSAPRLAHYAEMADDEEAVVKFGSQAALAAQSLNAHREAAAQYRRLVRCAGEKYDSLRLEWLKLYADECSIVDDLQEAISAYRQVVDRYLEAGHELMAGECLAALAWPFVRNGQNELADDTAKAAIAVLEKFPASRQLASAYRIQAHLRMLDREHAEAVRIAMRASQIANQLGDVETLLAAEMVIGTALLTAGDDAGRVYLDKCLAKASERGLDQIVAQVKLNLGTSYGEHYRFSEAEAELLDGMTYARERDLDHSVHYMTAWLALVRMYQGRWQEAAELANSVLSLPHAAIVSRIMALVAIGRVQARRGDPGAQAALTEALTLAEPTAALQRLAPVHAARAELAWLEGRHDDVAHNAARSMGLAVACKHQWHIGEFSYWTHLVGGLTPGLELAAGPFALEITGDWQSAASAWEHLGCPYEQARALSVGDLSAQARALEIFDALAAKPAADMLRRAMRDQGLRVSRGKRQSTRDNPFNLTNRELIVLSCIAEGLSNGDIGVKLFISAKTVDHHASSIYSKIGVSTRRQAAAIARARILPLKNGEAEVIK